jgi:hypothetical protein
MSTPRIGHTAVLLPSGQVLVTGGSNSQGDLASAEIWGPVTYTATIQPPINADGQSVFKAKRGVVPVKFSLSIDGQPTCELPGATIVLTRTAGGTVGPVNESDFVQPSDNGSNFRVAGCQYSYNMGTGSLGIGTYNVQIQIGTVIAGSAVFGLQ